MSLGGFGPGLVVLAAGLALGAVAALWVRSRRDPQRNAAADLELRFSDLEQRKEELYERLRNSDPADADRHLLETAAADTLRQLDELTPQMAPAREGREAQESTRRSSPLIAFASGLAVAGLLAALLFWAQRDATPRQEMVASPQEEAPFPAEVLAGLSPQARVRAERLLERIAQQPDDLDSRKALAETLLLENRLFEAYAEAEQILARAPGDPDALYFEGFVRLAMGQSGAAIELLDRAIASEPRHVSARLVRGMTRLRLDNREGAIEDFEAGYEAANRQHPGLERLLELTRAGLSSEEILSSPPGGREQQAGSPSESPQDTAASATTAAAAPGLYSARLDLADGSPRHRCLFVSLRGGSPGPPVLSKRIDRPQFPLEVSLGAEDNMLGRPIPAEGTFAARLDEDCEAFSNGDSDPQASTPAKQGEMVELVLALPLP